MDFNSGSNGCHVIVNHTPTLDGAGELDEWGAVPARLAEVPPCNAQKSEMALGTFQSDEQVISNMVALFSQSSCQKHGNCTVKIHKPGLK